MTNCELCGRQVRHGVPLPQQRVRVWDMIERAGSEGIEAVAIAVRIYGTNALAHRRTVKAHICHLNRDMAGTGMRIMFRRGDDRYFVHTIQRVVGKLSCTATP